MRPCGCSDRGVRHVDEVLHAAWHALVVEQGGPAGRVGLAELRASRGPTAHPLPPGAETVLDARNRAQGKSNPGWQRQAHHGSPS